MSAHDNHTGNFNTSFQSPCLLPAKAKNHADPVPKRDELVITKLLLDPSSISKFGAKRTEPVFSNLWLAPTSILKYGDDWSVAMLETGRFDLLPSPETGLKAKKDCVSEQKKQKARNGTGEYNICEDPYENISHQTYHSVNTDNALDRFVGTTADKKCDTKDATHNDRGDAFQNQLAMWTNYE